jgi:hypothetical protein
MFEMCLTFKVHIIWFINVNYVSKFIITFKFFIYELYFSRLNFLDYFTIKI